MQSRSELKNLIASVLPDIKIDYSENFDNWKSYFDKFSVEKINSVKYLILFFIAAFMILPTASNPLL